MRKTSNKTKITAIAFVLLLSSVMLTLYTPVQAQELLQGSEPLSPNEVPAGVYRVDTTPYLSFRPNPVGVGQTFLVNVWINPATHRSRYFTDYKVTITDPDGNEDVITMDSYCADTTAWFEYVADQVGTWKLKFDFPGGYFSAANLTGGFMEPPLVTFGACYYEPSSTAEQTLTVQEEMVLSWPPSPLPTDYWTRPVALEHREWWPILGDFPWHGPAAGGPGWEALWDELYPNTNKYSAPEYEFTPWVQAPNTAHIAWKRQGALSGIFGGDWGHISSTSSGGTPDIIYQGRCYDTITKAVNGSTTAFWQCRDIRTGEVYWEDPAIVTGMGFFGPTTATPTFIEYSTGEPAVPGAEAFVSHTASLVYLGGGYLRKFDPWTGAMTLERSIAPLTGSGGTYYRNGYVLGIQNIGTTAAPNYRLINWTTFGSTNNFANRVISNISWPYRFQPSGYQYGYGRVQADFSVGIAAFVMRALHPDLGVVREVNVSAASLETGNLLWEISIPNEATYSPSCIFADHGKVAFLTQNGYWLAYNLNDGSLAWKSERMDYPWSAPSFGAYDVTSAYGMLYRQAYDGVYAFDWDDGSIVWHYKAPTPYAYETPYVDENGEGVYPFNGGARVADGKLYTYNTEHTPTAPVTRGWKVHCIDAFTGEGIWNATFSGDIGPIADGYLTVSSMDGYMYVFGKGKSATTVSAPQTEIPLGESVMLTGSVLDQSPAQSGTPCVSKESMAGWMEYLHRQLPIPADVTGVPVSLDTLDPNGNYIHIGDVTTDGYSGTFGLMWTPEVPGTYAVTATFMGDDSYGSSFAQTYVGVGEAPEEPTEPAVQEDIDQLEEDIDSKIDSLNNSLMPILYVLIVVVVVVAILVVYTLWTVRKR